MATSGLTLRFGNAGLIEARDTSGERLVARFQPDDRGRWRLHEVWFTAGGQPFSASRLRDLPLKWLEDYINGDEDSRRALEASYGSPGPRFDELADEISTTYADPGRQARFKGPPARRKRRPTLTMPERVDEPFLHDLADAYREYVAAGVPPAPAIAAEVGGVSVRTVHAWIRKARDPRFGILPPGRKGAAG